MSPTYQPWMHPNHSASSLAAHGMEVVVPPGQSPPIGLSPTSIKFQQNAERHDSQSGEYPLQMVTTSTSYDPSSDPNPRPDLDSKRAHSSPEAMKMILPPPPRPPMSKHSQKILQLTSTDPRYKETFPDTHRQQEVSPKSSGSSGSVYSQPEGTYVDAKPTHVNSWGSAPAALSSTHGGSGYLQPSIYTGSETSASYSNVAGAGRATSQRHRERQEKIERSSDGLNRDQRTGPSTHHSPQTQRRSRFEDGFEHDIDGQYNHGLTGVDLAALVPRPLAIRTKPKKPLQNPEEKLSFFASARDSLTWGIDALTSPKTKHFNSAASQAPEEDNVSPKDTGMLPPPLKTKRKKFGSGNHPLKSPFPFGLAYENSDPGESGQKFTKRFSGAMRRVSGASKFSPTKKTVIPNSQRAHDGPDTPLPLKSLGLVAFIQDDVIGKGNVHFQEVMAKAKQSLTIKTTDEKRREGLKKKIVVIGITDQSPGM